MAIGVVTHSDFEQEMLSLGIGRDLENKVNEEVRLLVHGRGNKAATPVGIQILVAEEKALGAPSKELEEAFDVSASSVSAYGNGATSTASYDTPKPELVNAINATNDKIAVVATRKLMRALDAITDNKVDDLGPLKAADLASKMSNVIKNTRVDADDRKDSGVKIIVFQPRIKEEDEYQTIQVIED